MQDLGDVDPYVPPAHPTGSEGAPLLATRGYLGMARR